MLERYTTAKPAVQRDAVTLESLSAIRREVLADATHGERVAIYRHLDVRITLRGDKALLRRKPGIVAEV